MRPFTFRAIATAAGIAAAMPATAHAQDVAGAVSAGLLARYETVGENLVRSAEIVPEDRYSYRPTEDVRTLGELFTHVTTAHFGYCAAVSGQTPPAAMRTPGTTREQIIANLRASRDFCLEAYRGAASGLGETIAVFGNSDTRAGVLIQNVAHSNLHYGNVVTYMRAIGLVPPSSE